MTILNGRALHQKAKAALADAKFPPKKFVLVYALATLIPTMVINCMVYWFGDAANILAGISDTTHPAMASLTATISILFSVFLLFWQYSYTVFSLRASRREAFSLDTLWDGFRLWKRVLGSVFWMFLQFLGLYLAAMAICVLLMLIHPVAAIAGLIAYVVILFRFIYSLWAVPYMAMDTQAVPASALCALSRRIMQGRKWQVFKVQLHFLGYEILLALAQVLPEVMTLYTAKGISPDADLAALPFPVYLGIILIQTLVVLVYYIWKSNEIEITYAMAYNTILEDSMPEIRPADTPTNYIPDNTDI